MIKYYIIVLKEDGKGIMQRLVIFRRFIVISLSALLILIPAQTVLAGAPKAPTAEEETLPAQKAPVKVPQAPTAEEETLPAQSAPVKVPQAPTAEEETLPAQTTPAETTQAATAEEETLPAQTTPAETTQAETTQAETTQAATAEEESLPPGTAPEPAGTGKISYYESDAGTSSALVASKGETLMICFDPDVSGLAALLEQESADHIDSLIMACFSDTVDESALKELHESYPIGHLYATSGHAAAGPAGQLGIKTDYAEYLSVGDENVILYPDDAGNLGVLVFDENSSLFAADTMANMSVLQDHQEVAYINVLSISDKTGTDEGIISLMDPQVCIITGSIPDDAALSSFFNTDIAKTQTFYINHYTPGGVDLDFSRLTDVQEAAFLHLSVPDPALFVAVELETQAEGQEGQDGDDAPSGENQSNEEGGLTSDDGQVSAKQAIAEAALRIWRGEIGQGQIRTDTLRSEGFTDEQMKEVQRLVDKIASENLGACTAVIFRAGDYADDPDAQIISIGSTASELELSSDDEHYQFTGWYTDQACTEKFDFSTPIKDKTILYAGWEQTGEADQPAAAEEQTAPEEQTTEDHQAAQPDQEIKSEQ